MGQGNILVIDDEPDIRSLVEMYLIAHHYGVLTADCGQAGLAMIESQAPDLVVLDIMLPDMDGLEVCRRIRERCEVPILFLSCLQESEKIVSGLAVGGDDYLTKPFDPNVLVARIQAILRRSRALSGPDSSPPEGAAGVLTGQEVTILQWVERGFTNKEIADRLGLKEGTVKVYNHVIFQKLNARNRTQAISKAKEKGIL